MFRKSGIFLMITCISLMAVLAACGTDGVEDVEDSMENKEPIDLVFYSTSGGLDTEGFMTMFGDKIKEKFPHITPKFIPQGQDTSIDKLVVSGETIDIMYLSSGQTQYLTNYDLQYDITELIEEHDYDLSRMEPTTIEIQRMLANGGIYGLPVYNNTVTLFYNKDIFNEFGVDYPKDGLTWDELYELARKVSRSDDGSQSYQGITLSLSHNMLTNQLSVPYTDENNKVTFVSEDLKKLFTNWTRFYEIPGNEVDESTVSYTAQVNAFDKDKTIAMFLGLATLGPARFQDLFNWDVVSYPVFQDKPELGPQPYPTYFYITQKSKHKDEAFEVIAYLTSDEFQTHLARNGYFPALVNRDAMKEFGQNIPSMEGKNVSGFLPAQFASPAKPSEFYSTVNPSLTEAFQAVLLGRKDINSALRDAEEQANKKIEEQLAGK